MFLYGHGQCLYQMASHSLLYTIHYLVYLLAQQGHFVIWRVYQGWLAGVFLERPSEIYFLEIAALYHLFVFLFYLVYIYGQHSLCLLVLFDHTATHHLTLMFLNSREWLELTLFLLDILDNSQHLIPFLFLVVLHTLYLSLLLFIYTLHHLQL